MYLVFPLIAASVLLAWDASPEEDVVSYRLHWGLSPGGEDQFVDTGLSTSGSVDDPSWLPGDTIYFVATAVNSVGLESPPSNEVSWPVPLPSPTPTPAPTPTPTPEPTPTPAFEFSLTITSDFPEDNYILAGMPPGTIISVVVPRHPPRKFLRWEGDIGILNNFLSSSTTAIIPEMDTAVHAVYEP